MNKEEYLLTYCDELIPQLYEELKGEKNEPNISEVMPLLLFQSMVDKLRALQVLRDNGQARVGESGYGIVRTMYECKWYLLYMIKEDNEFRATAYYYFSRLDEAKSGIKDVEYKIYLNDKYIKLNQGKVKIIEGYIEEYKTAIKNGDFDTAGPFLIRSMKRGQINPLLGLNEEIEEYNSDLVDLNESNDMLNAKKAKLEQRIQRLEADLRYQHIRAEYDLIKGDIQYPKWYTLKTGTGRSSIKTLRRLAVKLGLEKQYDGSYSIFSQEIHGNNATNKIMLVGEKAVLKNLEDPIANLEAHDAFQAGLFTLSEVIEEFLIFYGKSDQSDKLRYTMGTLPV